MVCLLSPLKMKTVVSRLRNAGVHFSLFIVRRERTNDNNVAFGRLRQEYFFRMEVSLGYVVSFRPA